MKLLFFNLSIYNINPIIDIVWFHFLLVLSVSRMDLLCHIQGVVRVRRSRYIHAKLSLWSRLI